MSRPVRLLHCHGSFDLGGKEARTARLMNRFGADAVHVVLAANGEFGARKAIDPAVQVDFPDDAPSLAGKPGLGRYRRIGAYMKRFDLVLSYNWGSMDAVMANTLLGSSMGLPPLVHHEDGFNADEAERLSRKRNWFRALALTRAKALVVPSVRLEQVAQSAWHQSADKIHRIANGIDTDLYEKKPQRGAIPGFKPARGAVTVGTIAGLRPVKRLDRLVRAVGAAGDGIRLVIVGEGPDKDRIAAEAASLNMTDRLLMPGFLDRPYRFAGLFDIFALSSDSEQFPISVVEAMAAGLPVAAPAVGDIADMVSAANAPFITPPGDETALAQAIATLAADPKKRASVGEANRAKAQAQYNEDRMVARYRLLYASAMGRPDFAQGY
ncbi:glycosyltransferase family 4 protein [Novosphingopyxis sp. YJ-S2-01]|uniref:glycosyltransferase family 4 protein n=1 Tax=Novosphingopyxis sp. YJ-S2-01 TaxID=2794021 RepID=UPI0018DEC3E1|nr:glycosyltransferase family 4 protein [Novosphingopyxis sp. YJ-S2-01]MBH9538538.1 glycosyltransferase family 4 protein [Novosphingopyxis sp. YJ-S2-01]